MTKSGWLPIGFLHTWMDWYQISINGVIIRFWKTQNLPDFNLSNVARCFPFKIIFSRTSRLFPVLLEDCSLLFFITADLKPVKKTGFVSHWPGFQVSSWMFQMFVGAEFMVVPPMARLHFSLNCGVYRAQRNAQRNGFTSYTFFFYK